MRLLSPHDEWIHHLFKEQSIKPYDYRDPLDGVVETFPAGVSINRLFTPVLRFLKNEDGPSAVEYAVVSGVIILLGLAVISIVGSEANNRFMAVVDTILI